MSLLEQYTKYTYCNTFLCRIYIQITLTYFVLGEDTLNSISFHPNLISFIEKVSRLQIFLIILLLSLMGQ